MTTATFGKRGVAAAPAAPAHSFRPARAADDALSPEAEAFLRRERAAQGGTANQAVAAAALPPVVHGERVGAARIGPYLIDGIIMFFVSFAAIIVFAVVGASGGAATADDAFVLLLLALSGLNLGYFVLFEGGPWHATPGKRLSGLVVTDRSGHPIGYGQSLLRNTVGRTASGLLPFGIGYMIAFYGEHRAVHDRIAGTEVRRLGSAGPAAVF